MLPFFRRLIAVFSLCAAAHAAPLSPDPTGDWYNPNESGWGATIAQQGEVVFALLFVYDEQGRPEWFVASDVRDSGGGVFSGPLYRTTGPWFGAAFDPMAVANQAVGTLTLQYAVNFAGNAALRITYAVNGVTVTKGVTRLTWDRNAERLPGAYYGGITLSTAASSLPAGCGDPPALFPPGGEMHVTMSAPDTISFIRSAGIDTLQVIGGQYTQSGQFGVITGALLSGIVVSPVKIADAQVTNLIVNGDGFLGHVRLTAGNCVYEGSIAGNRR